MPIRKLCVVLLVLFAGFGSRASAQTARGPEFRVNAETAGHQMLPQVAMNALGEFVVVWSHRERESEAGEHSLHARRFAADGTPETGEILVRENVGDYVETAAAMMEDGSFVVVYAGHLEDVGAGQIISSIFEGRRFAADGAPLGAPFAIGTGRIPQNPSVVARPEGGFIVAWEARRPAPEVFVRIFDGAGSPVRSEIPVAPGEDPAIAVGPEGEIVLVWMATEPGGGRRRYFVALQRLSPDGTLQGRRSRVSNNSPQTLHAIQVARDGAGSFTVVWAGSFGGVKQGTFARRYSPGGVPVTPITLIEHAQFDSEMWMDRNGDFVLVWAGGGGPDDGLDVFGRKYRSLHLTRRVFRVNTTRAGHQSEPDVADDGAGNFVVVWQGEGQGGSGPDDIFARFYNRR